MAPVACPTPSGIFYLSVQGFLLYKLRFRLQLISYFFILVSFPYYIAFLISLFRLSLIFFSLNILRLFCGFLPFQRQPCSPVGFPLRWIPGFLKPYTIILMYNELILVLIGRFIFFLVILLLLFTSPSPSSPCFSFSIFLSAMALTLNL